jgi:hypothetical protein
MYVEVSYEAVLDAMSYEEKYVLARELKGYLPTNPTDVDHWYDDATDGDREHMANKLAKHGYPHRGKWHHDYALSDIVARLLKDGKTLEDLIGAWVEATA